MNQKGGKFSREYSLVLRQKKKKLRSAVLTPHLDKFGVFEEIIFFLFCYSMWVDVLLCILCLCTTCVPSAHNGWKRALDSLKLELWIIVTHHGTAGN